MSPVLPDETIDAIAEVGAIPFAVFCKLLRHRNRQTGLCCPSIKTIAAVVGGNRKTVIRAIAVLEAAGWIVVSRSERRGQRGHNRYTIAESHLTTHRNSVTEGPLTGGNGPRVTPGGVTEGPLNGVTEGPEPQRKITPRIQPHKNGVELPAVLDTPEFRAAWNDWEQHRREKKKPNTALSRKQQLKKLANYGPTKAIELIERAILKGWQGIVFPEEDNRNGNGKPKTTLATGPGQVYRDDRGSNEL